MYIDYLFFLNISDAYTIIVSKSTKKIIYHKKKTKNITKIKKNKKPKIPLSRGKTILV